MDAGQAPILRHGRNVWRVERADRLTVAEFARRALVVAAIAAFAFLLWRIADALLLAFGAVLLAVLLRTGAEPLARAARLPDGWAVGVVALVIASGLGLVAWLAGAEVRMQASELVRRVPDAWESLRGTLGDTRFGQQLIERASGSAPDPAGILAGVTGAATSTMGALANVVLVLFGGLYLALQPRLYRAGLIRLAPPGAQDRLAATLDASGRALRRWLLGLLLAMAIVAAFTSLGLWLIGLPGFLALGLLAGLAEVVPFVGPVAAAVPALLLALTQDAQAVVWTFLLYLAVQQIESNLVMPLIIREMVAVPPALTLFAIVAFGLLFGLAGVLLAAPLTVVAFVAVKKLWVREALGEDTKVPGEDRDARRG
jgi:predicted PurR-regulated permease PerM